ncbi:MAG: LacI family DNA-binding transcriptional regulator, partial [Psittacicella sp.]
MSDKKVTFKDVAKLAKVSTQTVSRVINNEKSVSDSTRERVTKAIKELNYIPNLYAQNLRKRNLKVILLITLSLKFHGASLIAEAIRVNAKNSDDYQVNLNIVDSENFIEETINYMTTAYA